MDTSNKCIGHINKCPFGNSSNPGHPYCTLCYQKYKDHLIISICKSCGGPTTGHALCDFCFSKKSKDTINTKCKKCGGPTTGHLLCNNCFAYIKTHCKNCGNIFSCDEKIQNGMCSYCAFWDSRPL